MPAIRRKTVNVFAPATVANLGCGFDVFGLAISQPGDIVRMSLNNLKSIRIKKITGDDGKLSSDPAKNTVAVAVQAMLNFMDLNQGFDIQLQKKMPLGSGLGSSAASAAAGVVAANILLGNPFTKEQLIPFAMEGERMASGSAHADNVAPSLLGGIVLIRSYDPLDVLRLPVPAKLFVVVVHPEIEVLTRDARAVLPANVSLKDAIRQWSNTAAFVAGLFGNDLSLVGRSVEDYVAEPYRKNLIPGFMQVKESAMQAGALGCSISGSGPSIFALAGGQLICKKIAAAMKKAFNKNGIHSHAYISSINRKGATVIA